MVRDDIKKLVEEQDNELYQDGMRDDPEFDDDVDALHEKTFGNSSAHDPLDIAKEIDDDEKALTEVNDEEDIGLEDDEDDDDKIELI